MAGEDDIRQRVIIEGADGARRELEKLGEEGAAAIDKIKEAGGGDFTKGFRTLSPELNKMVDGFANAEIAAGKLGKTSKKTRAELMAMAGLQVGKQAEQDLVATEVAASNLNSTMRSVSKTLKGLGRVTNIPGLGFLARDIKAVGANFGLIAGPAVVGAFGLLADLAAKATQPFQDLAFSIAAVPEQLQSAATSALAFGGDVQKLGESLANIPKAFKETAAAEKSIAAASANVRDTIDQGTTAIDKNAQQVGKATQSYEDFRLQIALGLDPVSGLQEQLSALNKSFADGKVDQEAFTKQSVKLNNQLLLAQRQQRQQQADLEQGIRDANQALAEQEIAQLKAEKAAKQSKQEVLDNANAYVKLGISSQQLKTLKPEEQFKLIAEKLAPMEKGMKRNSLAIEIFGDNARKFIGALDAAGGSIDKFVAEGQRITPAFTAAQNEIGDKFLTALGKVSGAIGSLKDAFGLAVAPAFTSFLESIATLFVQMRPAIEEFGKAIGPLLTGFLTSLVGALQLVGQAISILMGLFKTAADSINALFGGQVVSAVGIFLTLLTLLAAAFAPITVGVTALAIAFGLLVNLIKNVDFSKVGTAATLAFDNAKKAIIQFIADFFSAIQTLLTNTATTITGFFTTMWEGIKTLFNDGLIFISDAWNTSISFVTGLWEQFKSYLMSWVTSVIDFFRPLIDMIKKISAFFSSGASDATGAEGAFAGGGAVRGPGTNTSDSILAWLSDGEFVMRARAVAKYGVGFMKAINSGRLDLESLRGFALGGLIDNLAPNFGPGHLPAFAEGGAVQIPGQGLKPVSISFEGTRFDAFMTDTAINQLSKKSIRDRAKRAGRSPSWVGS